jgi:hypothetical protein
MRAGSGAFFHFFRQACLTALLLSCSSCAFFSQPPALPRHAAIETKATPLADARFAALVQNADIIYFPTELLGPGLSSEPAAKLMRALAENGNSFAIGWDLIAAEEQALLDQWANGEISTERLFTRLHLSGTEREREKDRALLVEAKKLQARFLALGSLGVARAEVEFAAQRIVGQFREHRDEKLLVFLDRRHLETTNGVPHFVAQKIKARQLVLDSHSDRSSRTQLLAWWGRDGDGLNGGRRDGRRRGSGGRDRLAGGFEIVDCPPGTSGDHL